MENSIMKQKHVLPTWFPYKAMSLFGVILVKKNRVLNQQGIQHETIHWEQQKELAYVFFFALYILEFIVRFLVHWNWGKAYRLISFEQEAYKYDDKPYYLKSRKGMSWYRFLRKDLERFVNRRWFVLLLLGVGLGWAIQNTQLGLLVYPEDTVQAEPIYEDMDYLWTDTLDIQIDTIHVRDYYATWKANKVRFERQYGGKEIVVMGHVKSIDMRLVSGAQVQLFAYDTPARAFAFFEDDKLAQLEELEQGHTVYIRGTISGSGNIYPTLRNSTLRW